METKHIYIASAILLVVMIFGFYSLSDMTVKADVDLSGVESRLTLLEGSVITLSEVNSNTSLSIDYGDKAFIQTEEEYEETQDEAKALELAREYMDSRDFLKVLYSTLNGSMYDEETLLVDSRNDITSFTFDLEYDFNDGVKVDNLKVLFFIDEDEDEAYKTRFKEFAIELEDVDGEFDKDYKDAEVDESEMDEFDLSTYFKKTYQI